MHQIAKNDMHSTGMTDKNRKLTKSYTLHRLKNINWMDFKYKRKLENLTSITHLNPQLSRKRKALGAAATQTKKQK